MPFAATINLKNSTLRTLWLWLAVIALSVQGLVPAGYMPDAGAHRMMQMRICTGDGFAIIHVRADKYAVPGKSPAQNHHQQTDAPCTFAVGRIFNITPQPVLFFVLLAFAFITFFPRRQGLIAPRFAFAPFAARAPPLFS